jgi:hypothetical protein
MWPRERFAQHGVNYQVSDKTKSDLYLELLPLLNAGRVELLDHPKLIAQLCGLERRTARSGRDSIDHGPGQHDDICNAAAGALCAAHQRTPINVDDWLFGEPRFEPGLASLTGEADWRDAIAID